MRVLIRILLVVPLILAGFFSAGEASASPIFFSGDYHPANWIFEANGGNGAVDTSGAPDSITLTGHDENDGPLDIVTLYSILVPANRTVSFAWLFVTLDEDGPSFDPAGYFINDAFFQLSDDEGPDIQSGFVSGVALNAGDIFGFYVDAGDGCCGSASLTISGTEIPEPSTWGLFGLGVGILALTRRIRLQSI